MSSKTIIPELVELDVGRTDKSEVIRELAARVVAQGRATDAAALFEDAWAREQKDETGLPGGIAIPHAKSAAVTVPSLAFARLTPGVDFGASDGPADLVFLIAAPADAAETHLAVLSKLARSLMLDEFTAGLRAAKTPEDVVALVDQAIGEGEAEPVVPEAVATPAVQTRPDVEDALLIDGRPARIVAVTSCATGIAHTFMAADALTAAGKTSGVDLVVEPQGSSGYQALPQSVIDAADAVIFANDVDVREEARFAGKPVVRSGVKRGIEQPAALVAEAVAAAKDPAGARVQAGAGSATGTAAAASQNVSWGRNIQRILLTGVSYMIPFVAGGGLLVAISFLPFLGGYGIALAHGDAGVNNAVYTLQHFAIWNLPPEGLGYYLGAIAFEIGSVSLGFLVPALAGYIAFAIADRPGIAPGFVAGAIAVFMNAGFLGGLVGGLLAGFAAWLIGRPTVPRWLRGLMPVVIIPLGASIIASGLMLLILGAPIAWLMTQLNGFLNGLSGGGAIVLGIILGLMMCFDLGGPVNKVAYAFAVAGLAQQTDASFQVMAAVMIAGMVPPLGMALASTVLYRRGFTEVERENGAAAWLLGASFISEGAIPFAAADPLRVIPANLVGGAVAGGLAMAFAVESRAPHGGVFVFFAIDPLWGFALALAAGTVTTALIVTALKRFTAAGRKADATSAEAAESPIPETVAA
ncbi:PTS fructose transporter subunit IIABC [Leifsonia sp. 21MFCrub1.1]|uniref:PTS fructose transporter subunit IIABC n=1 Tax=Leifsonia sp. 21MFCrub1.1 TaxID=1798223 RepID=UPI0008928341|nr:fructose-specific PTS transporter subunit EIIC [Leifsonia sp. 21MFCrub1.1]SEA96392.1 PTS system D-fructose-specific IIA component (F1P-forming), Frc family /PTS system D-fructose-specific IIB component (F1P-forming), Frc family /PTS system D-fructose-specific IIC component (F1P-forming), Frc family [Leifsonia sp. 21MFCrub1.1]